MRLKRFRQFIREQIGHTPKIYKSSHTTMPDVMKRFLDGEARFIITHNDKLKFGDADQLIHLQIAIEDPTHDWMAMSANAIDRAFSENARYAGYVSLKNKTFSIALVDSDGDSYDFVDRRPLSKKAKEVISFFEKKGFDRLKDGFWPR